MKEFEKKIDCLSIKKDSQQMADMEIYHVGDRVVHKTFGEGVILSNKPIGTDHLLKVKFDQVGTKKLLANYANLTVHKRNEKSIKKSNSFNGSNDKMTQQKRCL